VAARQDFPTISPFFVGYTLKAETIIYAATILNIKFQPQLLTVAARLPRFSRVRVLANKNLQNIYIHLQALNSFLPPPNLD
jgi:hypothetical protein